MRNNFFGVHPHKIFAALLVAGMMSAATILSAVPARAQAYTVNVLGDPMGAGCGAAQSFQGSLRQCVEAANAVGGANSINITVTGTILLSRGIITVSSGPLTITGTGARNIAIDGQMLQRLLIVPAGGSLNLSGVTLQHGNSTADAPGSAIENRGTVILDSVALINNTSSGVGTFFSSGTATIRNSLFANNFGYTVSAVELDAGINAITNTTVTGNRGVQFGPLFIGGTTTLTNLTVATNDTGGTVDRSALTVAGGVTLRDSALSGNTYLSSNTAPNCSNPPSTRDHNVDSGNTCGSGTGSLSNTDPLLAPLANNGGQTDTMSIPANSPAHDAGSTCPAADQRGLTRVTAADAVCDIGAYELGPPEISSLTPSTGPTAGGTAVTISGARFTGTQAVKFGSTAAASFTVNSDSSISAVSPPGTGTAGVMITNFDGSNAAVPADVFTYADPSMSASPSSSPVAIAVTPSLPRAGTGRGQRGGWLLAGAASLLAAAVIGRRRMLGHRQD